MHAEINRSDFARALQTAGRALQARPAMPILASVLLDAKRDTLTVSATDLELGIRTRVPAAIREPGSAALPGRILAEIAAQLPDAAVEISAPPDAPQARIACDRSVFELAALPPGDVPAIPEADGDPTALVRSDTMRRLIAHAIVATSTDEARPFTAGALVEVGGDAIRLIATDGNRLATRSARLDRPAARPASAIIPARGLRELARTAAGAELIRLHIDSSHAVAAAQEAVLAMRLIADRFPEYSAVIPARPTQRIAVETQRLLKAARRAHITAGSGGGLIRLSAAGDALTMASNAPSVGSAGEVVPAEATGEPVPVALNGAYLLDALETLEAPRVVLELTDPLKPIAVRPEGDPDALHVLAPVKTHDYASV
jgi:DNA polymerase-3 subunit beta